MTVLKCKKHGLIAEQEAYVCHDVRYKDNKKLRCKRCIDENKIRKLKLSTSTHCHIHGDLNESNAYACKYKGRIRYRCKTCCHQSRVNQYANNREKAIIEAAKWKRANRERINEQVAQDKIKNPEKHKKWRTDFYERNKVKINTQVVCRNVGLDIKDYESMIIAQENKCAICKCEETRVFKGKLMRLCIDHDHNTGRIRGLLCHNCNSGLGKFGDSPDLLTLAAIYLMD